MKIGIISDIHAYLKPFLRAMDLFESMDVDTIICAGDIVDGGLDGDTIIDTIRSHNIASVRGNHDTEAFADLDMIEQELWDAEEVLDDDFDRLRASYRMRYISTLPLTRHFEWEGLHVCLAHGSPWSNTYHVFPNSSADECQKIFADAQSDIVVLGHTHIPMRVQFGDKWIFNPGALCGNRSDLRRTCAILDLPQIHFEVFDVDAREIVPLKLIHVQQ